MARRPLLLALAAALVLPPLQSPAAERPAEGRAAVRYPAVLPDQRLSFPRDHGAHPDYRTEWWYATGWLADSTGRRYGFQVTFFRSRPGLQEDNPSAFAPRQLIFAHAAITDAAGGRLHHDQRAARAGFGLAGAEEHDTAVWIDDWSLTRGADGYRAEIGGSRLALSLLLSTTQPLLLQGEDGFSRKGPAATQASHYYSQPQLAVSGSIAVGGERRAVSGTAWLDHEWASEVLAPEAQGWDWTAINLEDGGALTLFRIRRRDGGLWWAAGTLRTAAGRLTRFSAADLDFVVLRRWRSPRTGAEYPVAFRLRYADTTITLEPLIDDQEIDARASTGTVYWEGAVTATREGRVVGRGYLELTGYFDRPPI
jgi:predicted secreted hydrolase